MYQQTSWFKVISHVWAKYDMTTWLLALMVGVIFGLVIFK